MLSRTNDWTYNINQRGSLTMDVGGYEKVTAEFIAPIVGVFSVYGSNDGGAIRGVTAGGPQLATNFTPIQATNLATGTATSTISAAGEYGVTVNAKYLRFSGGTSVYKLIINNIKTS